MARDLTRIGEKARQNSPMRFTSIYHFVTDRDHLRACYEGIDPDKATGIDGITKAEYGKELESNLDDLTARLGRLGYRPQPVRRVYIPKPASNKKRPLAILCIEDKLVGMALTRVLEQIYEADFLESSYGYRPGRRQRSEERRVGKECI